jgi:diadenosine tetraphosphate (Ap4A) HIT family hydrolase
MTFWNRVEWFNIQPYDLWKSQCPFCNISLTPLVKEFTYWFICNNKYPYGNKEKNLLLIPKRHVKYSHELRSEEWWDLEKAYKFIHEYFWKEDFFSFMRESSTWRSLEHLHYHFLPGFISGGDVEHILEKQ